MTPSKSVNLRDIVKKMTGYLFLLIVVTDAKKVDDPFKTAEWFISCVVLDMTHGGFDKDIMSHIFFREINTLTQLFQNADGNAFISDEDHVKFITPFVARTLVCIIREKRLKVKRWNQMILRNAVHRRGDLTLPPKTFELLKNWADKNSVILAQRTQKDECLDDSIWEAFSPVSKYMDNSGMGWLYIEDHVDGAMERTRKYLADLKRNEEIKGGSDVTQLIRRYLMCMYISSVRKIISRETENEQMDAIERWRCD